MVIDDQDLMGRIVKIRNLREECFKYLEPSSSELLTHKVLYSIARLSSSKMGPVKLAEIAQDIFGESDKSKQDLIRLTVEKTLLRCGAIEKLHYAPNDVRYLLTAYRFQKVRKIESFRGDNAEPVGDVIELPRSTWPISEDFLFLISKRNGVREALKKLHHDYDLGRIQQGNYNDLKHSLDEKLEKIDAKIAASYAQIAEITEGA
ncbi:MAG TPA: hypothetical protein VIB07_05150 [Nitrososphaera sp.]|jgi:hypothetical protein